MVYATLNYGSIEDCLLLGLLHWCQLRLSKPGHYHSVQVFFWDQTSSNHSIMIHLIHPCWDWHISCCLSEKKTWVYWGFASLDGWMWWSSTSWVPRKGIERDHDAELWKDDCRVAPSGAKTHLDLPVFCGFLSRLPKHICIYIYMYCRPYCLYLCFNIVYIHIYIYIYIYTHHLIQWPSFPSRHRRIMAHHGPWELGWSAEEIIENGQVWNR